MRPFLSTLFSAFTFVLLLGQGVPTWAMFADASSAGQLGLQFERNKQPLDPTRGFAIYPNVSGNAAAIEGPVLLPRSKHFIPIDTVGTLPMVYTIASPRLTDETTITNLLYANLRLKQLIEQYLELKKRAKTLLAGIDDSVPARSQTPSETSDLPKPSLFEEAQALNLRFDAIAGFIPRSQDHLTPDSVSTAALTDALSPKKSFGIAQADQKDSKTPDISIINRYSDFQAIGDASRPLQNTESGTPWALTLALNMFRFVIAHGAELVVYGALLLSVGFLLYRILAR